MQRFIIISIFLFLIRPSFAQINQITRFEIEQKNSDASWTIVNMKQRGIALLRDKTRFMSSEKIFEIHILDSLLTESSYVETNVPSRMNLIGYEYTEDYLYILLRSGETDVNQVLLLEYNLTTKDVARFDIKHEFTMRLTHFVVLDRHAILAGYVSREPAVLIYDIREAQMKVVPGFFSPDTELLDLRINANGTFNTLVTNRQARQDKKLILRTFDATGAQLMEDLIPIDPNKTILSGLTSSLVRDELMIAGTYTIGNGKIASGFFSVMADPFKEQAVHYYDFAQLDHFLDYLSEKRAEKIKATAKRYRDKSRDPDFKANVSNVKLEEKPTGFYLLAEAYSTITASNNSPYPYYGYNPYYMPMGYYGYSPYASRYYNSPYNFYNNTVRNDFSMLSTSVLAFTSDGKLEWDHSLKADDSRKQQLEQVADFWSDKNKIVIVTKVENDLVLKVRFKNDEVVNDTVKLLLKKPTDLVREDSDDEGGVRHWFGKSFYVWGYQTVKDPEVRFEDRTRSVFYLVKVNAE